MKTLAEQVREALRCLAADATPDILEREALRDLACYASDLTLLKLRNLLR